MLCLGKSLVVILNYALTAEQPDPCGPEPYSPGKRPRTRSPLREGPVTPHVPGEVALSQNSWGPRTSQGVPDPHRVPDPIYYPDPSVGRSRYPAWGWSRAATCQWVRACARDRVASPGRLAYHRIQYGGRSKARGGFCQVALLVACYQGAQCSRWRRPRRVCQSTMPVGHDGSVSPIMTPAR